MRELLCRGAPKALALFAVEEEELHCEDQAGKCVQCSGGAAPLGRPVRPARRRRRPGGRHLTAPRGDCELGSDHHHPLSHAGRMQLLLEFLNDTESIARNVSDVIQVSGIPCLPSEAAVCDGQSSRSQTSPPAGPGREDVP